MVGGGFVDGIVFHPTAKGVRYARTDMGGAYRWNDTTKRWEPILDWVPYENLNWMGVESIALDPADPNRVYLACGTYTNPRTPDGAILRSSDRGKTFQYTNVPIQIRRERKRPWQRRTDGGGSQRRQHSLSGHAASRPVEEHGPRRHLEQGREFSGCDGSGRPSAQTPAQPQPGRGFGNRPSRGAGIVFTIFDPRSGSKGKPSSIIYAGVSLMGRENLFRSTDAGKTWLPVPGQPTQYRPTHAVLASDGTMYLSYGDDPGPGTMTDGGVWKWNTATGEWTEISPEKPDPGAGKRFGYAAVAVDAHHPRVVIASSFKRPNGAGGEDDMFRSIDGGKTWKPVFGGGGTFDYALAPYVARTPIHWLFDIEIDPANSDHAMFTTGYGGWETFNLTAMDSGKPTKWSVMATGIEETVALELVSPTKGAHLISAIGDYGGFVHWDLDKPNPEGSYEPPLFSNTNGVACAENKPEVIVRVGRSSAHHPGANIGYSLDGGKRWQPPASAPQANAALGHIAVSSDGNTWVWTPQRSSVFFTRDRGATWIQARGIPDNTRVIADRVNPQKFYGLALFDGKLFVEHGRRRDLCRAGPGAARRAAETRWQPRRQSRRAGPHLCHAREGGRPLAGCVQRLVPFHRHRPELCSNGWRPGASRIRFRQSRARRRIPGTIHDWRGRRVARDFPLGRHRPGLGAHQ